MEERGGNLQFGLLFALLLAVVVGCSEIGINLDTPPPPSGIRGLILLGPTCPVEASPGANDPVPCLTPYAATLVVLDSENVKVATVTSGPDGKFSVDVPPGEYRLRIEVNPEHIIPELDYSNNRYERAVTID